MSWPDVRLALVLCAAAATLCATACPAAARAPRWTEHQAERALLSRANVSYADCLPLDKAGRSYQCLIEYTDGGERFLVLVPRRDGFGVRSYERTA